MTNIFFEQVGNNIQNILLQQGKTQQYLADQLKVSKQVMSKIIAGSKAINVAEISKIATVLEVSVDELLSIKTANPLTHNFNFMGKVKNEETKRKITLLQKVIDEILMLEEYSND